VGGREGDLVLLGNLDLKIKIHWVVVRDGMWVVEGVNDNGGGRYSPLWP
jgi:hypothetical protein